MSSYPTLHDPEFRRRGLAYLRRRDPDLGKEIRRQGDIWPTRTDPYFDLICRIIIDQQISVRAGQTIWERWAASLRGNPTPARALDQSPSDMRACGISAAKGAAIRAVAEAELAGTLRLRGLGRLEDERVRERLTAIRGIGPWSAEMFLIFGLGRPDIFSTGDLGLRRAMRSLLQGEGHAGELLADEESWLARASRWSPYRSLASLYLWRLIDGG